MISNYDPRKGKKLQILREDGTLTEESKKWPLMPDEKILEAYNIMIQAREADEWAVSLNRQGRLPTYAPNKGQEANSMGAIMALDKDDWFVPAFRELAGMIYRGLSLKQYFLYWLGNEVGGHLEIDKFHMLPLCVPLATQTLHAVGLAYADQYRNKNKVTITFLGDGSTSEGDFYEAMNFAGNWKSPLIFYIQNNQWAISTPRKIQTSSITLAEKSYSCGFEGIQIDGNDVLATYAATKVAAEKGLKEGGPTLIEGVTYRLGAHTTADDPTRYRDESEVKQWMTKDPLLRIEKYLFNKKIITDKETNDLKSQAKKNAMTAFDEAEAYEKPTLEDTFRYTFKEIPPILKEQMERKLNKKTGGLL